MLMSWIISWAAWAIPFWEIQSAADLAFGALVNGCAFGLSAWYLYGTEQVKAYYRVLELKSKAIATK